MSKVFSGSPADAKSPNSTAPVRTMSITSREVNAALIAPRPGVRAQ
jgi:hypothetical protein